MNPFRNYMAAARTEAVASGIVRDVAGSTKASRTKVSRTFAGEVKRPDPKLVQALNAWLMARGFPPGDGNGRQNARNFIDQMRSESQGQE